MWANICIENGYLSTGSLLIIEKNQITSIKNYVATIYDVLIKKNRAYLSSIKNISKTD